MNLLETIKLKSKIFQNDYAYIENIIKPEPECIIKLTVLEQGKIIKYLIENNKTTLLSILFELKNKNIQKMIYEKIKNTQDAKLLDKFTSITLKDLLEYAIAENNLDLIYYIAKYIEKNHINNNEYINMIKEYLLKHKVDITFIEIAFIPLFKDSRLEDMIINSKDYALILNYILNSSKNSKFLKKYILSNINYDEFSCIARELKENSYQSYMNFKRITLEAAQDKKINSRYLLIIINNDINDKNRDKCIKALLKLNDFEVIKEFMKFVKLKEQEKYADWALKENNARIILTLACTTNCFKTKDLIDYIIKKYNRTYVNYSILISNLEGDLLEYAIDKIYKESGEDAFMEVFNFLAENEHKGWITMIDYVKSNCILYHFSISNFNILLKYKGKLEEMRFEEELKRVRNFT